MPFDAEPWSRDPVCPHCGLEIRPGTPRTLIHAPDRRSSAYWHAECARLLWDTLTPLLRRLGWMRP